MINNEIEDKLKKYNSRKDTTTIILIIVIIIGLVADAPPLYFAITIIPILIVRWILSIKYKNNNSSN